MSSKGYSKEERESIRIQLLSVGLSMYAKRGIKEVRLEDILTKVGISKPFFYKFYPSVQEFVVRVIEFQWMYLMEKVNEIESHQEVNWTERVRMLFDVLIHHRHHGILIMSQKEEVWVRNKLSTKKYHDFMDNQIHFFQKLLNYWGIPYGACDPKVLANLMLSMCVFYNSAKETLPFFYLDELEAAANAQAESIILYLENAKKKE